MPNHQCYSKVIGRVTNPVLRKKNAHFLPAELSLGVGMGKAVRTLCQGPTDTSINAVDYPKYQWQEDGFGLVL